MAGGNQKGAGAGADPGKDSGVQDQLDLGSAAPKNSHLEESAESIGRNPQVEEDITNPNIHLGSGVDPEPLTSAEDEQDVLPDQNPELTSEDQARRPVEPLPDGRDPVELGDYGEEIDWQAGPGIPGHDPVFSSGSPRRRGGAEEEAATDDSPTPESAFPGSGAETQSQAPAGGAAAGDAADGGGSSGSSGGGPSGIALAGSSVSENAANGTLVGTVGAAAPAGGVSYSYSLLDDAGGRFSLDSTTGEVRVADGGLLDYEADNSHSITVRGLGSDGSTVTEAFTIGLMNLNEAPDGLGLSGNTVDEGAANGTPVGTVSASDPDVGESFTYALTDDAGGRFTIDPTTGGLQVADGSLLDFGAATSHDVTVRVTDSGGLTYTETFTISVNNLPGDPPTDLTLTGNAVDEGSANGTAVGTLAASDPDVGETFTYALTDDAGGRFTVDPTTGAVTVADGSLLDFESAASHSITARVTDSAGFTYTETFTINVGDVNEAPTDLALSANTIDENAANGTAVGTVTATDPDAGDSASYALTDDAGGRFAIDASTGAITVADGSLLDFESATSHDVTVRVTDGGGNTYTETFTINVGDVNEVPTDLALSANTVDENAANGTAVGTVSVTDPDTGDSASYALTDDAGGRFAIDAASGAITVADGSLLDFESATSHDVTVRVTDGGSNTYTETFTINLGDVNEAPTDLALSANSVDENAANGTAVGAVSVTDPDAGDSASYVLTDDAGGRFAVDSSSGAITVADGSLLDFESATSHDVTVQVTDGGGNTYTETFTINVGDVNETPTDLALSASSVDENAANGTAVGSVSVTDPDAGDSASYALTDDAGGRFAIDAATGSITVADGSLLDFESATSHDVTVRVTDGGGNTYTETFTINVGDVNEAPTDLALSANAVDENAANGAAVGTVSVTDPDSGDSASYVLTDDAGGRFAIDSSSGAITVADGSLLDFESATSHDVTVRVTDGGGNTYTETFTINVGDVNEAPTDLALSANSVDENAANGTAVGTVSTTDPDAGDSASYALTDDAGGRFAIDAATGAITVADGSLLDFEAATSHDVTVQVTDGGGNTYTETFTINLGDVNEAPTDLALSANTVDENAANGTTVGTVSASDPDAGDSASYALTDDAGGRFAIDGSTGAITVADGSLLDFESATSHDVTVRVTDAGGLTYTETFTINLGDVNEAPTDLALSANSVDENAANGTPVGTISTTDPDAGDSASYVLTDDAGGRFAIDGSTGAITVADGSLLDFENATSHDVTVRVTDGGGNTYTETFTINLGDVNEAPTDLALSASTVDENAANGTAVGTISTTDPDAGDSASYVLTDDAGGRFAIDSSSGAITVADGSLLDFESATSHDVTVQVTDGGGLTYTETFTISVGDVNEAPTDLALSANAVDENAANGTAVGAVSVTDPDAGDSASYVLTDDAGGRFAIDASTGAITVADGSLLDFESATSHDVTVQVTDGGGNTYTETFTINVGDINEAPTDLALSANSVDENAANGTAVGTITATDPDVGDSASYTLTDDAGGRFAIDGSTGAITVADGSLLDFEAATSHDVTVRVTDGGGNTYTETFTINLGDVNEAPTDLALSGSFVTENAANGTAVGTVTATDPDAGDSASYVLTDDAGGRFAIDSSTGAVTVADGSLIDLENATSHDVTVRVTDSGGLTYTETFTINVGDLNEAPTDLALAGSSVNENAANGSAVGTVTATDPDAGDSASYALTDDAGGRFAIDSSSGAITVADGSLLDFESATSHDITVQVTDGAGNTYTETFTISVGDVNEAPTDLALSANSVDENAADGTAVGTVMASDPDAGDSASYVLTDDAGGRFAIDGSSGAITVADGSLLDFESATSHDVTVRVTDGGGLTYTETFTINLGDVNEAPTDLALSANSVDENAANGTAVGTVSTTDPDAGDSASYVLTDDAGGRFAIDGSSGAITVADGSLLDFESATSHDVTVQVTDGGGNTYTETFTINLGDVNEAPTDLGLSANSINENAANGTAVGKVCVTDPDAGDSASFVLTDDAGGRFTIDASTGSITVADGSLLDFESATSHDVTVQVTDSGGLTRTETFTINVNDINEAPTDLALSANSVDENAANGTAVGTVTTTDPDAGDSASYVLTDDAAGRFVIDASTGAITVADGSLLDFESATSHDVTVRVTDGGGNTYTETFTINVGDLNEAPTDLDLSANAVDENAANGTAVGTVTATDPDAGDSASYALTDDAGGRFAIDSSSGAITVADGSLLDFESATSHDVTVRVTDGGGLTYTETFTINVGNQNEAPLDLSLAGDSVDENAANGTAVGTISTTDPDSPDTTSYVLTDDAGGRFAIDSSSGAITVADGSLLDFESATSHDVTVQVTDGGSNTYTETFTINVGDVNEAPTDLALSANSINENAGNGSPIGKVCVTDPDAGDSASFVLTDDAGGRFAIDAATGEVTVADGSLLDFESATSHDVTVRVTDSGGLTRSETFTINVSDVNETPTDLALSANSADENAANGTAVGTVSVTDPDAGDSASYALTDDAGGRFAIDAASGAITVANGALLDFESAASHDVTVRVTDGGGNTYTETFTINLGDVNEAPTDLALSASSVDENAANGTPVGSVSVTDPDVGDSASYVLTDDAGGRFAIDASTGAITVADGSLLDFESATSHDVTVRVTDGGGNTYTETFAITVGDVNEAPSDLDLSANTVSENAANGTAVGSVSVTDPDAGDSASYVLTDDAGGRFAIDASSGAITVADGSLLDFESATSHDVTVRVTDGGGLTYTETFTINLGDLNEAPTDLALSANTVDENAANGTAVGAVSVTDPDAGDSASYTLTDDAGGRFAIDNSSGAITVADGSLLDFETTTSHDVTVRVTDGGGLTYTETFTINVGDVNEAPTDLALSASSVDENAANGTPIGTVTTTDPDAGDSASYALTDDAGGRFAIDASTGAITVADGSLLDFESATSHDVTVRVTDGGGNTYTETFTINVGDVNEAPTDLALSANAVDENAANGTPIGSVSVTDPDAGDSASYALTSDAGGRFAIDSSTGAITVADGSLLDFESATSHDITVRVTDGGSNTYTETFTINVGDVNEAPTDLALSANAVDENAANGTAIGTVSTTDPDAGDSASYALTDDAGGRFAIDSSSGAITVADGSLLDFESATSHDVTVRVTDGGGNTYTETFTINLGDVNEAPTDLALSANTIDENAANGTAVGTVTATDPDAGDSASYVLTDDAGGRFAIDASSGAITVADGSLLDFESATSHDVTVQVTDGGGLTYTETFTINVGDVNEAPTDLALSANAVDENAANGTAVGAVSVTDPDAGDSASYVLTDDAGGRFAIDGSSGAITVADGSLLDFESATSHDVTVQVTDGGGNTYTETFTINVGDINEAPTDLALSASSVDENAANGTAVGAVSVTDPDAGDSASYVLTDDAGGRFAIDSSSGAITVADGSLLDFESATSHDVTVRVTDGGGNTYTETFTISVGDVNEAPTDLALSASAVDENAANGTAIGTVSTTDPDAGDSASYVLTDDAGGRFAIDSSTGAITVADGSLLDFESATSHDVTVRVTDSGGNTYTETFTINVGDVNEAPTDLALSANAVDENAANGATIGTVSTTDPDAGDSASYALTDTAGGRFAINASTGAITVANGSLLDFESATSHDVTVRVTDGGGNTYTETFTINVGDVNEAPTDLALSANAVDENAANGTAVGTVTTTDPDIGDSASYVLTDDAGGRFAIDGSSGAITVADGSLLDFESATSHDLTVRVTDGGGNTYTETFTISVGDVNETPTDLALSANSVDENASNGTAVGTVSTTDPDSGDSASYVLTDDAGGRFAIDSSSGAITVADGSLLDFESSTSHDVTVRVTDGGGNTYSETFTINVGDLNEAPTDLALSANSVDENAANGTAVGAVSVTDPDAGDSASYALTDDAGGRFAIDASSGAITVADGSLLDFESATSHDVTVQVIDGGGNTYTETFTISVGDVNEAPTDLALSANSVDENAANGTAVGSVSVTDPDTGDSASYALTDDAGGRFAINSSTGAITVANGSLLDFESATSHDVTVRVTDGAGNAYTETFTINVGDVNEVPTDLALSANAVDENAANGTAVGTVSTTDPDAGDSASYVLTDDAGGRFAIDAATGAITVADGSLLNFESATSHDVTVRVTDGGGLTYTETFTINLGDVNETPTDLALSANSVDENAANGTAVGTVSVTDPDTGDSASYVLMDDAGGRFTIDSSTGAVSVADGSLLDFESATSHDVTVRVTDGGGNTYTETFTINVGDVNETPTDLALSASSVDENAANGTAVGTVSVTDPDAGDSASYALTDDAGGRFAIDAATGAITVADGSLLDFESATSHDVTVRVTDGGGLTYTETFTINVGDVNEAPTDLALSANTVDENAANGTAVGAVSTTDPDAGDSASYVLTDDAGGRFAIDASTGAITVADGSLLDFESATSHDVTVQVTDGGGLTYTETFTINLGDVNEAPTDLALSANSVDENAANGTAIGTVSTTDPDAGDSASYILTDDAGGRFAIDAATGAITVADGSLLDFESATSHNVTVRVTDGGGNTYTETFTINLGDVNEAPTDILFGTSVDENAPNGTVVDVAVGVDPDAGDSVTYALTDNAGGRFAIDSFSGQVTVADGSLLDFESASSHDITVQVTDSGGLTYTETFTVSVNDVNEAPTDLALSANSVDENAANGAAVGSVSTTDPDAGDSASYALTDDAGGRFAIDASTGAITVADGSLLDFESATSHDVTVQVTDGGSNTYTETFTINLGDVNEAPTDLSLSANSVDENAANGTAVGSVSVTDPDAGDSASYVLTDDAGGRFAIDAATGAIAVADGSLLDFESATSHDVTVQVTDGGGNTYTETFTINVGDINEAPTDLALSANSVDENATNGTAVGAVSVTDPDAGDSASYLLAIDASSGAITVADGSLLDFESATSHDVTVRVTDGGGLTYTETFAINVGDVNEAPTDLALSANAVDENAANGTAIGTVSTTDPDAGDSASYLLTDDAGGRFAIDAASGAITVADGSLLDFESATSHDVTVRVTDGGGLTYTETFTINVGDVNEAPTDLALSANSVDENAANGTAVGTVSTTDPDAGDSASYALTDTAGGRFAINASTGAITVADGSLLDFESATSHDVTVRVTDAGGLTYTETFTINVGDLNEAPTLTTADVTGDEDTAIPLSISLGDLEPGATQSVLISGVPTGATLSAGTDNGDGTWTLTPAQVGGLTITPPQHSDADFQLTVTASSDDGSTVETTGPQTIDVTVDPVADTPNLTVTSTASGTEDGSAAVNIPASILALDGDPGLVVTISNVPTGATLSAGTDNGDGTWTLGSGELGNLIIEPPAGDPSSFTLGISATAPVQENPVDESFDSGAGSFTYADDSFRGTSAPAYASGGWNAGAGQSGGGLTMTLGGIDDADINGMSGGFSTSFTVTESSSGSVTFSYRMIQADPYESNEFSQVLASIDGTLVGQGGNDYITQLNGGGDTGWQTVTLDLGSLAPGTHTLTLGGYNNLKTFNNESTEIRFDNVDLTLDTTTTITGSDTIDPDFVELNIASSLVDTDGSESLTVVISGVPTGATLSAGTDNGDGSWTVDPADLPGLTLFPPEDFGGTFQLTVTATATDGSDTADAVQTIDVTVSFLNEPPVSSDSSVSTSEDTTVTFGLSDFGFTDAEGDGIVEVEITTLPSDGSLLLNGVAVSAGDQISAADITAGNLTFEPTADSDADPSFTFRVSDGAHFSVAPATMSITVDAVADAPSLTVTDAVADNSVFQSTFETGDTAGSFINGTVDGWSPSAGHQIETWHESEQPGSAFDGDMFIEINNEGSGGFPDAGSIERTISTTTDTPYELSFQVSPRPGFESYMDFQVRVVDVSTGTTLKTLAVDWDGNTVSQLTWTEHSISFLGTGGDVRLVIEDVGAVHPNGRGAFVDDIQLAESSGTAAGDPIALSSLISVALTDTDGSESLDLIEIAGIPEGFTLESGGSAVTVVDGVAQVTPAQLSSLTMTSPDGFTGDVDLSVTASSTEAANGDTASVTDTLTINIVSNDENLDSLGLASNDTLNGDGSANTLYGGAGVDTLNGNGGDDSLFGGSGDDILNGGSGADVLLGGDGDDTLNGGANNDLLQGGTGDDTLNGGDGVDSIFGGAGNDTLNGDAGDDRLYGAGGSDLFIFAEGNGNDQVSGGTGGGWTDVIQLQDAGGGAPTAGWTYVITQGSVESSGSDFLDLSDDAAGTVTLADGSEVTFEGIERIEW